MEIDDRPVPDVIIAAFCRLVDHLDGKSILDAAAGMATIFQGHRVIAQNVPVARQRIKSLLNTDRHLDTYTTVLLRCAAGLANDVVVVLSDVALRIGFSDLASYFGEADFLASALLDERKSVRDLAHEFIAKWDCTNSDNARREAAAIATRFNYSSFFENVKGLLGDDLLSVSHMHGDHDQVAKHKQDKVLASVKSELDRITKKGEREGKGFQDKITGKQKEIDRLSNDLLAIRNQSKIRDEELSHANRENAELQSSLQQGIEQGVRNALSAKLRQWLVPAMDVERVLEGARQSDLVCQVVEALERQRAADLHYGNRVALTLLIEERRRLLAEIQRARVEALNPLPELRGIAVQLEREIGDLVGCLGLPGGEIGTSTSGIFARINEAQSLDELSKVRQFIQQAAVFELFGVVDLNLLYRAVDSKAGFLYDKAELLSEHEAGHPKSRFFLRQALARGYPFRLFIDGHNVLFALENIFGQYFVNGLPEAKARVALTDRLDRVFDKPGPDVLLYFDGNDQNQHTISDQMRVMYSGGTGKHRTDEAILANLTYLTQSGSSTPICLVTRDADFARQAREMGVNIIDPREFAVSIDL